MIYFDNAASATPFLSAINFVPSHGNPSSNHKAGYESACMIRDTRLLLSSLFGGEANHYYFSSGATESANLIIQGVCLFLKKISSNRNEIVISEIEHPAVYNTVIAMKKHGFIVKIIPVTQNGIIDTNVIDKLINKNTAMVCIMGVNNETGAIQPVNHVFKTIKKIDDEVITICDAVQMLTKIPASPDQKYVDCFFASGHKLGASKGIGFFYLSDNIMLEPLFIGGEQEGGIRPGTENIHGIQSIALALKEYIDMGHHHYQHVEKLNNTFFKILTELQVPFFVNTQGAPTSNYVISISFPDVSSKELIHYLSQKGVCVSRGSACSSVSVSPSRVLSAMQLGLDKMNTTLRISFSCHNTLDEVNAFCEILRVYLQGQMMQ